MSEVLAFPRSPRIDVYQPEQAQMVGVDLLIPIDRLPRVIRAARGVIYRRVWWGLGGLAIGWLGLPQPTIAANVLNEIVLYAWAFSI